MAYTTIKKPSDYFDISNWTATTSAINNLDFSPDWVWIKSTDSGNGHILFDTIRGANKRLSSASNIAESTRTDELMSFDSNGYTLGSSGNTNDTNPFNASYVGWSWRGSDSLAVSNTDGSITSTVSANTTSGFSIVSYTSTGSNATVGHGLGVAPAMIIFKRRSGDTENWVVYHKSLGATKNLKLNLTDPENTSSERFNNTEPTSSVFSLGISGDVNGGTSPFIAYCFAEKKGFSKFGSYTGNGNADGTFVYTGFKPAFIIVKRTDGGTNDWILYDTKRCINGIENALEPNNNNSEATVIAKTDYNIDLLSNGFKPRSNSDQINNGSYIYIAFAEEPLVGDNPATAR